MTQNIIVYDQDPFFLNWLNDQLGITLNQPTTQTISHVRQNDDNTYTILAVIAFSNIKKYHVEASIAASTPRWATWNFLHAAYEYAFNKLNISRINFVVDPANEAALSMHEKLGSVLEGKLRSIFGDGKDGYIFGTTRADYENSKWYKRKE